MLQKAKEKTISVAIQGGYGSFHEIAARQFFTGREIDIKTCDTFGEVFDSLSDGNTQSAIIAIENSVAGSILPNYARLRNSGFRVGGETYIRVVQNLVALPGQSLDDIIEIQSHPVAIEQCSLFLDSLRKKGVRVTESFDTALSAKWISDFKVAGVAAIAGKKAAEMYGLNILAEEIESDKQNFTRFLFISGRDHAFSRELTFSAGIDKAMLCFSLPHKTGSLSQVLSVLAYYMMNLTKIQSLPVIGKAWEYLFYIDLQFSDYRQYRQALDAIRPLTEHLEILGEFRQGKMPSVRP